MKNLRKHFPILQNHTYLNTASSGILYDSLLGYRQQHDLDFLEGGSNFRNTQQQFLNDVRTTIANTFGSITENTVLVPNFSLGLNTVLNGLEKNKKVLLLDEDYPSINFAVTSKDFTTCYATIGSDLEQNIEKAIQQHRPHVFAFSLVQYINGISIDLDFLKTLKNNYPDLLIIADGTQFCGTKVFDFATSGIDILGCSGYKWLLGGYGNGFMLFADGALQKTTPLSYIKDASHSKHDPSYTSLHARFQCGHLDTFNFGSLQHSISYLDTIGFENIENHLNQLGAFTKKELSTLGLLEQSVSDRAAHSTIFNIKGTVELFNTLKNQNIITSLRGQGVRISLHFYNSLDDVQKLLAVL